MYQTLNIFFFVFHTSLILFNMFGWIAKRTRRWNLLTLFLTGGTWLVSGIWYQIGYCPCTDWHHEVRRNMGFDDMSGSYIKFLLDRMTGLSFDADLVTNGTALVFFFLLALSLYLNINDYMKAKSE